MMEESTNLRPLTVQSGGSSSEFLHRKIGLAGSLMRAGEGLSNDEVEADFAARRAQVDWNS